jgi:Pin2-interacting protein X1
MGLAEPKRRKKLTPSNHGPSAWSKAAPNSSVGFKLMASMGWAPGKGLGNDLQGEKDNIKYSLKDDLLGIGAKKEYGGGVWRGMGEVDDLYRRLDVGGSPKPPVEEVTEVTEVKEVIKLRGGWTMNFQVGDTYKSSFSREESEVDEATSKPESSEDISDRTSEKPSKKRKRKDEESEKSLKKEKSELKVKKSKKDKKENSGSPEKVKKRKSSKEPKEQKASKTKKAKPEKDGDESTKATKATSTTVNENEASIILNGTEDTKNPKDKKDKKDKYSKKERSSSKDKKLKKKSPRKEKKERSKKTAPSSSDNVSNAESTSSAIIPATTHTETSVSAPPQADRLSPVPRHMHRSRYLAMKRASVMDPSALREILGVKG